MPAGPRTLTVPSSSTSTLSSWLPAIAGVSRGMRAHERRTERRDADNRERTTQPGHRGTSDGPEGAGRTPESSGARCAAGPRWRA